MCDKCSMKKVSDNHYTIDGFYELSGMCENCYKHLKDGDTLTDLGGSGKSWSCNACSGCHKIGITTMRYYVPVFCEGCKMTEYGRSRILSFITEYNLSELFIKSMKQDLGNNAFDNLTLSDYIMFGYFGDELPDNFRTYIIDLASKLEKV